MSARNGCLPAYRLHKPSGQARVIIHGKHLYLGKYGTPESQEEYARLIAELTSRSGSVEAASSETGINPRLSTNELILAYWQFVKPYYSRD